MSSTGGGKDLATAAGILEPKIKLEEGFPKTPNKIPGGLVTKGNSQPGFEMVRGGNSKFCYLLHLPWIYSVL